MKRVYPLHALGTPRIDWGADTDVKAEPFQRIGYVSILMFFVCQVSCIYISKRALGSRSASITAATEGTICMVIRIHVGLKQNRIPLS